MTRLIRDIPRETLDRARAEMDAFGDNDPPSSGGAIGIAIGVGASVAAAILIGFALWAIWRLA